VPDNLEACIGDRALIQELEQPLRGWGLDKACVAQSFRQNRRADHPVQALSQGIDDLLYSATSLGAWRATRPSIIFNMAGYPNRKRTVHPPCRVQQCHGSLNRGLARVCWAVGRLLGLAAMVTTRRSPQPRLDRTGVCWRAR